MLLDFKLSIVDEEMKHTLQALANPEIANDPQRYMEIMQRYKELHETQSIMAQRAGDRVVLNYNPLCRLPESLKRVGRINSQLSQYRNDLIELFHWNPFYRIAVISKIGI